MTLRHRPYNVLKAKAAVAVFASCVSISAFSATSKFNNFVEEDEKPWAEAAVNLPAFPSGDHLIPFTVGVNSGTTYAIDAESLTIGGDGVIRFALVIVSASGAKSVSYEGMRCSTAERRFYASGRPDNTWSEARNSQWIRIRGTSNNHHVELYSNYFCAAGISPVVTADDARRALRSGGQSAARIR